MATSYICEHSAGFSLVPALKQVLESEFEFVTPVFPWISRELSKISKLLHKDDRFHILVMFPRRPKISGDSNQNVYFTVNSDLVAFKEIGSNHGVPVIGGCPNANNFWNLAKCKDHIWFHISHPDLQKHLISIQSIRSHSKSAEITDEAIISLVNKSRIHNIGSFETFLRDAKNSQQSRMYGAQYKPVYFLIKMV